jgi:hypothetical protein
MKKLIALALLALAMTGGVGAVSTMAAASCNSCP